MEKIGLKQDVLDGIKSNPILFGKVCSAADLTPRSLNDLLTPKNNLKARERLASATVIQLLRNELKVQQDSEILEEIPNELQAA